MNSNRKNKFKIVKHRTIISSAFQFLSIAFIIIALFNTITVAVFNANSTLPNASVFALNANLGLGEATLFVVCLMLMFTILKQDLDMRGYEISETEKRLEKFYIPTRDLIESIKESNYCIGDYYKSSIKNSIKELSRWKYLVNEENTELKEEFTRFENAFMNKKYLTTEEISHMNYLLDLVKQDITSYENAIVGQLAKL